MKNGMRNVIILLFIMGLAGSVSANELVNPGFEDGDLGDFGSVTIPGWTTWGSSGRHHDGSDGAVIDTKAVKEWHCDTGIYQDFPALMGREYEVSINAHTLSTDRLKGWDGLFKLEWFDADDYKIEDVNIGYFYGAKDPCSPGEPGDPPDTWKVISATETAPMPAAYGRVVMCLVSGDNWYTGTAGAVHWDDVYAGLAYAAQDPSPADNSSVDPGESTTLSWTRPDPRQEGDTILCDVWFGTDPDMPGSNTKILDKQDANSVVVGTLTMDEIYYWRVDCYDPNGTGPEIKTEGRVWTFDTGNATPTVDAGDKQVVWLASGSATVSLDATASDDGLPNPPGELTYAWTVDSGPGTPSFDSNDIEDPNVTFTVAGDYVLRLTVSDSDKDANDVVTIRVFAEGYTGLIAHWKLDETSGTTAVDSVGGHDGTLAGDPVWQSAGGQVNGAIDLDGDGDYVDCGGGTTDHNTPTWADLTDEITISAWIKGTFDKPWQSIVTKGDSSWRLTRDCHAGDSNNVMFACNDVGQIYSGSTGGVSDDEWHQIVGSFDGIYMKLYIDGILAASNKVAEGATIALNDYDVRIGSDAQFDGQREFNGLIDEVRIYEIGLPADKILAEFIADGGHNSCGITYLVGDINGDCYVDFADFAEMAANWLKCNDVTEPGCN